MKRFSAIVLSSMFFFAVAGEAAAELVPIYGPVYVAKTKDKSEHHRKEAHLTFNAPVPGKGVIVVKNGGDSGKKGRVSAAEIDLNGREVADKKDFRKTAEVLEFNVDLLAANDMEVEVKSCRECVLEITVMGERPVPPPRALPVREIPVDPAPVPLREPVL